MSIRAQLHLDFFVWIKDIWFNQEKNEELRVYGHGKLLNE